MCSCRRRHRIYVRSLYSFTCFTCTRSFIYLLDFKFSFFSMMGTPPTTFLRFINAKAPRASHNVRVVARGTYGTVLFILQLYFSKLYILYYCVLYRIERASDFTFQRLITFIITNSCAILDSAAAAAALEQAENIYT